MKQPHFEHVKEHLERVRDGYSFIPDPESVYLGQQEEHHFWELIGLRLQGCPVIVLAALRFKREERMGVPDARMSLASYLAEKPDPDARNAEPLTALLPNKDQEIPAFLAGLRAGREFAPVNIEWRWPSTSVRTTRLRSGTRKRLRRPCVVTTTARWGGTSSAASPTRSTCLWGGRRRGSSPCAVLSSSCLKA